MQKPPPMKEKIITAEHNNYEYQHNVAAYTTAFLQMTISDKSIPKSQSQIRITKRHRNDIDKRSKADIIGLL